MKWKKYSILTGCLCSGLIIGIGGSYILKGTELKDHKGAQYAAAVSEKVEPQKQYDIGSVSKVFTGVAVMQLVESGKVDLDKPLTTYIPEFEMKDPRYKKITTRMLLNHTSGIMGTHFKNTMLFEKGNKEEKENLLEELKQDRLKIEPGIYSVYCNDGFTLAEILVERVSGMSFSEYITQNILKPLEMSQTGTPQMASEVPVEQSGTYEESGYDLPNEYCNLIGSGGILSTTEDLCKFSTLFMKDQRSDILNKKSVDAMLRSEHDQTTYLNLKGDSSTFDFGLGFDSVNVYPFNQYGVKVITKGGSVNYNQANLMIAPDYNCSVAVLNSGGDGSNDAYMSQAILMAILEEKGAISHKEDKINEWNKDLTYSQIPESIKSYEGFYSGEEWYEISFPNDEEMLIKSFENDKSIEAKFKYAQEGFFVNDEGYYFETQTLQHSASKGKVTSRVWFVKENDGEVYLCTQDYMAKEGFGVYANLENALKRQKPTDVDEKILNTWRERANKVYYPIYDKYTSTNWFINTYEKLEVSDRIRGYIKGSSSNSRVGISKIMSVEHAQAAGLKRDMTDIAWIKEDGKEYLTIGGTSYRYISEDALETYKGENLDVKMGKTAGAIWYKIDDEAAKKQRKIHIEGEGAVYIYNSYHHCIYSSMRLNGSEVTLMPKDGTMVLIGEAGTKFKIEE